MLDNSADPSKLGGEFAESGTKSFSYAISDDLASLLGVGSSYSLSTMRQAFNAYDRSSAVAVPVNLVAELFSMVDPVIENMETQEQIRKHPLLDLIRAPHPSYSRQLFLETCGKNFLIGAECPIVGLGSERRPPQTLQPLTPTSLSIQQDSVTGLPSRIDVSGPALSGAYLPGPRDFNTLFRQGPLRVMRVIRGYSTKNDSVLRGRTKLSSAATDVWQQIKGSEYNVKLLDNGGRPTLIFHFKSNMTPEIFLERKKIILDQVEGVENTGRVLVSQGGEMEMKEATSKNRDMEFQVGQASARNVIAQLYKVPIVLLTTDAATFSNYEKATLALWHDAIFPLAETILGGIGEWLLPQYGEQNGKVRLTFDRMAVLALRLQMLEEIGKRKDNGVETPNEIRKTMPGLEPDKHGNDILVSGTMTTLASVVEPPEPPALSLPGGPGDDPPASAGKDPAAGGGDADT